jgi:hypothetical protein
VVGNFIVISGIRRCLRRKGKVDSMLFKYLRLPAVEEVRNWWGVASG